MTSLLVRRRMTVMRILRCMSVSAGTTVLSAAILVTLAVGIGVPAGTANLIAVGCGIPPSYLGNRRWVWKRRGRHDIAREVVPFWVLSLAGLVASTWLVANVGHVTLHWSASTRAIALPAASLGVFGALWIAQFALLDRVIFRPAAITPETT
jgi:putative flippase GtrA